MQITIQKFNAVVEGHNVHRQMLHEQINEQISEIKQLRNSLREVRENETRMAQHVNRLMDRAASAEDLIARAAKLAAGEGISYIPDAPGGKALLEQIAALRQAVSTAVLNLEQEREVSRSWQRQCTKAKRSKKA